MTSVLDAARAWAAQDPDVETVEELNGLITLAEDGDGHAARDLERRFSSRLAFGTAGLRGPVEAGPMGMNRVLVAQAAAGLSAYLLATAQHSDHPTLVIGYDGRTKSDVFARDTAELAAAAGLKAILLPRQLPTPVLAFAVRYFGADAGVMVTASHNPPRDNGYKVYLGGTSAGSQIVAPADTDIAAAIAHVAETQRVSDLPRSIEYEIATDDVVSAYVEATAGLAGADSASSLSIVYTAMHGVGWETFARVAEAAGFSRIHAVDEQREPDARFPTVAFPNPEEDGALDLAIRDARQLRADIIVANDPDADRVSIAIPDAHAERRYRQLTGNEVGWLLGWQAAQRSKELGLGGTLAVTIVSSPALRSVAEAYGLSFAETLTGFKWVSRVPDLLFGYEEALGYLVNPDTVRDKDGISAAVAFIALAENARREGHTVADLLQKFAERFGTFASDQVSVRFSDLSNIQAIMAGLRSSTPTVLGDVAVERVDDLLSPTSGPATDALRFTLGDGSRVMVRPSGTEPKLKFYIDVRADDTESARARVSHIASALRALVTTLVPDEH